jgi:hypothetical protein
MEWICWQNREALHLDDESGPKPRWSRQVADLSFKEKNKILHTSLCCLLSSAARSSKTVRVSLSTLFHALLMFLLMSVKLSFPLYFSGSFSCIWNIVENSPHEAFVQFSISVAAFKLNLKLLALVHLCVKTDVQVVCCSRSFFRCHLPLLSVQF